MKTVQNQLPLRNLYGNIALVAFMIVMLIVLLIQDVRAQEAERFQNDPFLPAKHQFNAGIFTSYRGSSIPAPVLIGEVSYGLTSRFSIGLVGGTIGTQALVGIRMAASVYQKEKFRLLYRMSILYYPGRDGTFIFDNSNQHVMPWILGMGFLDAEWRTEKGIRWSIGMGFLESHCADGMMNMLFGSEAEANLGLEVFNTIQGGAAIPLSKRFTLRPEAIVAFEGTQIVSGENHKVGPLYLYVHLAYSF